MNPETNRFEEIPGDKVGQKAGDEVEAMMKRRLQSFFDHNDIQEEVTEVPVFQIGEEVALRGYRFRVARIDPGEMVLEPIGVFTNKKVRRASKKSRGRSQKKRKSGSRKKR
jgi:uncharacterized Zn finger protein